jgi:hypothetical protein
MNPYRKQQNKPMKNALLVSLISVFLSCTTTTQEENALPVIEATAIVFNNNLPVDGCAEHISFVDAKGDKIKDVLPTDASMKLFTNVLNAEITKMPEGTYTGNLQFEVNLKYIETQEKGELICGWGNKSVVDKIEIVSITKK